jgi:nickel-dependent lactate racemase
MAASVELMFGKGRVGLQVDPDVDVVVVEKPPMPLLPDPQAAVAAALKAPAGGVAPLRAFAAGKRTACILICDITRPVPNGLTLPILVRALLGAGVPAAGITVLVATGLHRPNEGDELRELVGDDWVLQTVRCVNHFARSDEDHIGVGTTSRGTVVRLDRRFVEAEVRIATGLVEPHFMAGYSGGRKVISPGIAHAETITTFHSARFMEDPKAVEGNLDGNPLHLDQLEIVAMLETPASPILSMNVVIDDQRRLAYVSYGAVVASHEGAVAFVRDYAVVPVAGPRFGTVVTSAAGYPLDKTYYQTVKGMATCLGILAPGGDVIIVSECSEGFGSEEYKEANRRLVALGPEAWLDSILDKTHADIDEWQTEMQMRAHRASGGRIHLWSSGLSQEELDLTGVKIIPAGEAALADAVRASVVRQQPPQAGGGSGGGRVAVIPEGPYLIPVSAAASL